MSPSAQSPARILVVTPSFNHDRYIEATIQSVLAQDYPHMEYRIIDGGSKDGTVDILRRYEDRLSWISEPDRGYADAVRKGFADAKADYLIWLPSDDLFSDPGVLSRFVEHLGRQSADVIYGEAEYIDDDARPCGRYATEEFDARRLRQNCFICQPATLFSSRIYHAVGGIDPRWKSIADYDLWLRFSEARAKFSKLNATMALYRLQPNSITVSQRGKTYKEILELMLERFGRVEFDWVYGAVAELSGGWIRLGWVHKLCVSLSHRPWFQRFVLMVLKRRYGGRAK